MWTLQSTSTHKGPRGHVFSPCLKWKGPIHHWLFVTERETTKSICVCVLERACKHVFVYAGINYTHIYSIYARVCIMFLHIMWFVRVRCTATITERDNVFSECKYHDWNIQRLHTLDKSRRSAPQYRKILTNVQTNMLVSNVHVMNVLHWLCVQSSNNRAQDKCWVFWDNKAALPGCVTSTACAWIDKIMKTRPDMEIDCIAHL